jgi:flagellar motor switch protein FliN/FliY
MLRAAGSNVTDPENFRVAFSDFLRQALDGFAANLTSRIMAEVARESLTETLEDDPNVRWASFRLTTPDSPEAEIAVGANADLLEAIAATADSSRALTVPKTLDRLLDVELPISVSFGRAQIALKDVLKLTTGSILELDRTISEPVDVIVNNCAIARGEVVVVEGNFGVRVLQVISRQERIKTIS